MFISGDITVYITVSQLTNRYVIVIMPVTIMEMGVLKSMHVDIDIVTYDYEVIGADSVYITIHDWFAIGIEEIAKKGYKCHS